MQFIDEARIFVQGGHGGRGSAAFRREAHTPKGGPAGGDGGHGGSVVLVADPQLSTLLDLKFQQHHRAERGEDGRGKDQYGRCGLDREVRVPVGTVVYEDETGELLCDLAAPGQRFVAAAGGRGGRGNIHFKSPTNRAPRQAEPGTPGEERWIRLELKLLADVGLVGYPNVGKSTFVSRVSRARPKIADYPFTTLIPHLGVAQLSAGRSVVVADIPGLIEGASAGAGLGQRFLRHVERTRVLIHLLEVTPDPARDPERDYEVIQGELTRYAEQLATRPQVVAVNKLDLPETREVFPELQRRFAARGVTLLGISGVTGEGIAEILERAAQHLVAPADDLEGAPGAPPDGEPEPGDGVPDAE